MPSVFEQSPVINSPFRKPERHFALNDDGSPTGEIREGRRPSAYFVPIPPAKKKGGAKQADLALEDQGGERVTQNDFINEVRGYVERWRDLPASQWGVSHETARLLLHWCAGEPQPQLFFCQIEAMETITPARGGRGLAAERQGPACQMVGRAAGAPGGDRRFKSPRTPRPSTSTIGPTSRKASSG